MKSVRNRTAAGPWREPREETVDLYPNLVVHDGRQAGSVTVGRSRLPLWCFIAEAVRSGWDEVEASYEPTKHYGFTEDDLIDFLHDLLEARGEFGRLLLALANAERLEGEREDAVFDAHTAKTGETVINVSPWDPNALQLPGPWWADPVLKRPVVDQLRRCLDALSDESAARWEAQMAAVRTLGPKSKKK